MTSRIIALVALLVFGVVYATGRSASHRLDVAQDSLAVALKDGARQKSQVDFLTTRAGQIEARADSEAHRADSLAQLSRKAEIRYVVARSAAPDTCKPVLVLADSAIGAAQAETESARTALRLTQEAANGYRTALDTIRPAYDRLRVAAVSVDRATRPGLVARLTPHLGLGVAGGVDVLTRRPAIVTGLTLGWSF